MPITAGQLVRRTRELVQLIEGSNKSYRDGFSTDPDLDADLIPVFPSVVDFVTTFCSMAGVKPRNRNVVTVPGQTQYQTDEDVSTIIQVYFNGAALLETTRDSLDRTDPLWQLPGLPGDDIAPRRWFQEGDMVVLDGRPMTGQMFWRIAETAGFSPFLPTGGPFPGDTLDDAFSISQYNRIPYGAAYLLINIDAMVESHQRRIAAYKQIADGLLAEINGGNSNIDYSRRISLDTYTPEPQSPRSGIMLPSGGGPSSQ